MKRNVGSVDRMIRLLLAVAIGFLYYVNAVKGDFALGGVGFAVVFFLTGLSGFCPIYALLGISTQPTQHEPNE